MNFSTAVFLINKDLRAVLAMYEPEPIEHGMAAPTGYKTTGAKKKTMFKTLRTDIAVGDLVVVPTDTRHGMTVVKVTDVDVVVDFDDTTKVDWIVDKVDQIKFAELQKQEAQAIEVLKAADFRKRREALAADLTASADEIKSLPIYKNGGDEAVAKPPGGK